MPRGGHFQAVCQYGYIHVQCRCFAGNKTVKQIICTTPALHRPDETYDPKHRRE